MMKVCVEYEEEFVEVENEVRGGLQPAMWCWWVNQPTFDITHNAYTPFLIPHIAYMAKPISHTAYNKNIAYC